jgi:hypothetical protein
MFVVTPVSSRNTSFDRSQVCCQACHCSRALTTSSRCCSLATSVFFIAIAQLVPDELIDRRDRNAQRLFVFQPALQFHQGHRRAVRQLGPEGGFIRFQTGAPVAAKGLALNGSGFTPQGVHSADKGRADTVLQSRLVRCCLRQRLRPPGCINLLNKAWA